MRFLTIILVLLSLSVSAQTNSSLLNSVISSSGSSITMDNNFVVQQCVGQQGPLGLVSVSNTHIRQGFIQPSVLKSMSLDTDHSELHVSIFPNPTTDNITLLFDEPVDAELRVSIYDVNGRLVLTETSYCSLQTQLSVGHLLAGSYFVISESENNHFVSQISISH